MYPTVEQKHQRTKTLSWTQRGTSNNTSGYAKNFSAGEYENLRGITYYSPDGAGSYRKLTDKVVIPSFNAIMPRAGGDSKLALKLEPTNVSDFVYAVPWVDSAAGNKVITCTPNGSYIAGFSNTGLSENVDVNASNTYTRPIINLNMQSAIWAPTLSEIENLSGPMSRTIGTYDFDANYGCANPPYSMTPFSLSHGFDSINSVSVNEDGSLACLYHLSGTYEAAHLVVQAMKKEDNGNITCINGFGAVSGFDGTATISLGIPKSDLEKYCLLTWIEVKDLGAIRRASYPWGYYWNGNKFDLDSNFSFSSVWEPFKGNIFIRPGMTPKNAIRFGNKNWWPIGYRGDSAYLVQADLEPVRFNSSTEGYSETKTGIILSGDLSNNGMEIEYTGAPVNIPTDGITITGFSKDDMSFQYRSQTAGSTWQSGTPTAKDLLRYGHRRK